MSKSEPINDELPEANPDFEQTVYLAEKNEVWYSPDQQDEWYLMQHSL